MAIRTNQFIEDHIDLVCLRRGRLQHKIEAYDFVSGAEEGDLHTIPDCVQNGVGIE